MNPILKAMANVARGFLNYVDEMNKPFVEQPKTAVEIWKEEEWKDLQLPDRKVKISSFGRIQYYNARSSAWAFSSIQEKKDKQSFVNIAISNQEWREKLHSTVHYLLVAKLVLVAFKGEPTWAAQFPNVLRRSNAKDCVVYKDGNQHNCRIDNLEWSNNLSQLKELEATMKSNDKSRERKNEKLNAINHLAPLDRSYYDAIKKPQKTLFVPDFPILEEPVSKEEWRDVPHFVGFYQVASSGKVRSLDRYVYRYGSSRMSENEPRYLTSETIKKYDRSNYRFARGIELKPVMIGGALCVTLCKDGISVPAPVSQIVLETFYPDREKDGFTYKHKHIDGNVRNCALSNLQFVE